jgi:hypothetical protein
MGMGNLPNTVDDAGWLDSLTKAQATVAVPAELEARILASFDEVTAAGQASIGAVITKLIGQVRDAVWPGAPAWKPASILAFSLAVGILVGNYLPLNDLVSDQAEQTASIALDAPPAFDLDENS